MLFALRRLFPAALIALLLSFATLPAADTPPTFPLSQVQPGLKGVAYTIFTGNQIEKMDLVVLGVLHNALGPRQDVILVQLLGEEVTQTGVVAGMSGSPVYFDGKLAGAISLRLGTFTKEAIAGVTPIEDMLEVEKEDAAPARSPAKPNAAMPDLTGATFAAAPARVPLPDDLATWTSAGAGTGQFLVPIETPLITSGLYPETLALFGKQLSGWGMSMMAGGTTPPTPEDANVQPGNMVGIDFIRGDLSVSSGCTVTSVDAGRVLACGHPIFGFGRVEMPLSRAYVITTLASSMASTKIISTGGIIGTLTEDRHTAIMGKLGAGPPMIPVDLTMGDAPNGKKFHFEVIENPELTPVLVALATFNGITGDPSYGEGSTLQLDGTIALKGHTPVNLENLFTPTEVGLPTGFFVASEVQQAFAEIYSNPYEMPRVEGIQLHVSSLPERRSAEIDSAWVEKSVVQPGETVAVKVLLRPYRGSPFIQEIPIRIPEQVTHGTLELLVSDAETLDRNVQFLAANSEGQLPGLEELIKLLNRERHNDRLYATLLQRTPTLLVEDKEMPNAPVSEVNVLDQPQNPGGARLLYQSKAGEWSVEMHQVITGERTLTITVK